MGTLNKIDLNLDAGESPEALADGSEEALYQKVTSVNIACGGHAGDPETMLKAVQLAKKHHLRIGAHPSFPDKNNFGRKKIEIGRDELIQSLVGQMKSLKTICDQQSVTLSHVKPHGALYNLAADDFELTSALIEAVSKINPKLPIVGLAGSLMLKWIHEAGLKPIAEAFVDRAYEANGKLRSREKTDAVIQDPKKAAEQALQIFTMKSVTAVDGSLIPMKADTLCIHGDNPQALEIIQHLHDAFSDNP